MTITPGYGLTDKGFFAKPYEVTFNEITSRLRGRFGPTIAADPESIEGQTIAIVSEQLTLLWEAGDDIYSGFDPDKNVGQAQDAICAITGTFRLPASKSAVVLTFTGDTGTTFDPETKAEAPGVSTPIFSTLAGGTLAAADAWIASHAYVVGDVVTNDGDGDSTPSIYVCTTSGLSASSIGPGGSSTSITDGTAHWRWVGDGDGFVSSLAYCTVTGPFAAPAFSLSVMATPVDGILGVLNLDDAAIGRDVESHEELRVRREQEVARPGTGTVDAIVAAISDVGKDGPSPVTSVAVFNNRTNSTDATGLPAHNVEALVEGGDDQEIFDTLLANVDAGMGTYGNVTGTAVDSEGTVTPMGFSRPEEKLAWITISLVKNPRTYPVDGDEQVKQAIFDSGFFRQSGIDIDPSWALAQAFKVLGVIRVPTMPLVSVSPVVVPVSSTPIVIAPRQRAKYSTARIRVISTDGEP